MAAEQHPSPDPPHSESPNHEPNLQLYILVAIAAVAAMTYALLHGMSGR